MSLRDLLLRNGVSPRDLAEAVEDARTTVVQARKWASLAERILLKVAAKPEIGKIARIVVVQGAKVAGIVKDGAGDMLTKGKRR
jgi:hypothetical protein